MLRSFFVASLVAVLGSSSMVGCASPGESNVPAKSARVAQPEVVAIDVFKDEQIATTCSGTLLAKNVVLTAAHCVSGNTHAFVHAPDADGQTSAVKLVRFYDWTTGSASEHDLALLVLSDDITIAKYPTIRSASADGISATQAKRTSALALDSSVSVSKSLKIAKGQPVGKPNFLFLSKGSTDAGGGLFTTDKKGKRSLVGVMVGRGQNTKGYYAARLDGEAVQSWITTVIASPLHTSGSAAPNLRTFAGDDDFGGGGDDFGGFNEEPSANEEPASNEEPTSNDQPASNEEPASNEQPASNEEPASNEQPASNEEPKSEPSSGSEPTSEPSSGTEPASEKAPTQEEPVKPSGAADSSADPSPMELQKQQEELQKAQEADQFRTDIEKKNADMQKQLDENPNAK